MYQKSSLRSRAFLLYCLLKNVGGSVKCFNQQHFLRMRTGPESWASMASFIPGITTAAYPVYSPGA